MCLDHVSHGCFWGEAICGCNNIISWLIDHELGTGKAITT